MGGVSNGSIRLDKSGNGLYRGYISLDNYGGFSSIRLRQKESNVDRYEYLVIGLYGDNKYYQFRVKSKYYDRHVYGYKFFAKDEWQEIKIPLSSMRPQFRGRGLRMDNFNSTSIVEFGILIGNKVEENFSLLIDYIAFE
jgi:Complex I intermediate-associated protein 30 (CIA30).